ncbi:MAG: fibronectin type III domain-containing protein [Bacteroidales bacterium]|jgi:hypothetical protein|nr:fibronectin type III domain-containing protein [Bacteroidales bacterium]
MKKYYLILIFVLVTGYNAFCNHSIYNPPSNLNVSDLYLNDAVLSWENNLNAIGWIVNYKVINADTSFEFYSTDTLLYIDNLVSGLRYIWKVQMIDINNDTTSWSSISTFKTLGCGTGCSQIENLSLYSMNVSSLTVQWEATGHGHWEIACGDVGSNPESEGLRATTSNFYYSFSGLEPLKTYQIAVRGMRGGMISDWSYVNIRFLGANSVWNLPVQIDFEFDDEDNIYEDSTDVDGKIGFMSSISNPFVIGTAENATNFGSKAVYISSYDGVTTGYIADTTISYMYFDFFIPSYASSFYIDFKWKAAGNSETDNLKVYQVYDNYALDIKQLPEDNNKIGQMQYFGDGTSWQSEHIEIQPNIFGYTIKIIFAWESVSSGTIAVSLDDIYITGRYCPNLVNLHHSNITSNSVTLSWSANSNQTLFNIQYRKISEETWQIKNGISNNYYLDSLDDYTTYVWRVQSDCGNEQSFWSDADTFTTYTVIIPPTNIRLTALSDTSANVCWDEGTNSVRWLFEYKEINSSFAVSEEFINSKTLSNLTPNTSYIARLRALTSNNDTSNYSDELLFQTFCSTISNYPVVDLEDTIYYSNEGYCNVAECWRTNGDTLFSPYYNFLTLATPEISFKYKSSYSCKLLVYTRGLHYSLLDNLAVTADFQTKTFNMTNYTGEDLIRFAIVNTSNGNNLDTGFAINDFKIEDICLNPDYISITSLSSNSITVNWQANENHTSWQIVLINLTNNDSISKTIDSLPFAYDSLIANNSYLLKVRSICLENDTSENDTELSFVAQDNWCLPPQNFTCIYYSSENGNDIVCEWQDNDEIAFWEIEYKSQYAIDFQRDTIYLFPFYTIRDVPQGERYQIRIRTVCGNNDTSMWSLWQYVNSLNSIPVEESSFSVFPNPTHEILNIKTELPELKQGQLINSNGVVLKVWETLPMQIDVSSLSSGIYFIRVMINGIPVSKRFTIKK